VLVDHRGRILDANQACAKLLDTTVEELMNSRFGDFLEDPSTLVRSLRARRSGNAFINVDLTLKAGNERIIDCLMTATYLGRNALGANVFQAMIKDVTDRKQEENRLRKLNADLDKRVNARTSQLLEALEDIGSFSYTVAHDLRSPLKTMAVMSEHLALLNVGQGSPVESHELAERIQRGAQRMLELVDDLLRFSQTNKRELDRREIDLALLAQEVIEDLGVEGRKDQITLEMEQGATVMADAPMLKVVLQNLLSNAVKFTRAIPQPRIVVGHRRDGERDLLFVKDNGVGFDTKQQEQVFLVFKRLHTQDQFEGSGVGLAIVKRVVSKHGGEVWAESAPGLGTTINVVLPRQELAQGMPPFIKVA
jgi:PAS domain S-box-containing protein